MNRKQDDIFKMMIQSYKENKDNKFCNFQLNT